MDLKMVNNYNAMSDGSLMYDKPFGGSNPYWRTDPENLCHLLPVVPECSDRRVTLRTLSCGRTRGDWYCEKFKKSISVKDCNRCQSPTTNQ